MSTSSRSERSSKPASRDAQWIARARDLVDSARAGNLEPRLLAIDVDGDLGELLHGLNDLLDVVDAFVRESGASLEHVSRRQFFRRVYEHGFGGSFTRSSTVINEATQAMCEESHELAMLRSRQTELAGVFESSVLGLADSVAAAATELNATASQLSTDASTGVTELERVVVTARTAPENVAAVARAAGDLSNASSQISSEVLRANGAVDRAVDESAGSRERVDELTKSSDAIASIVAMIDEVAEQANMLALNAAIEAARAGQWGRGFAVVANEVKELAGQTRGATRKIEARVQGIEGSSCAAVASLRTVTDTLADVHAIASSTQAAVDRQHTVTDDVRHNTHGAARLVGELSGCIETVSEVSERTAIVSREILEASGGLSVLAERLRSEALDFIAQVHEG